MALPKDDMAMKSISLQSVSIRVHLRFMFLSCLLLIAACKPSGKTGKSDEEKAVPETTRSHRPPREDLPDKTQELREQLAKARMSGEPEERDKLLVQVAWNAMELDPELAREAADCLMLETPDRIALITDAMRAAGMPEGPSVLGAR